MEISKRSEIDAYRRKLGVLRKHKDGISSVCTDSTPTCSEGLIRLYLTLLFRVTSVVVASTRGACLILGMTAKATLLALAAVAVAVST